MRNKITFIIPDYIRKVKTANSRRPIHFELINGFGIGSRKSKYSKFKIIPNKYIKLDSLPHVKTNNYCTSLQLKPKYCLMAISGSKKVKIRADIGTGTNSYYLSRVLPKYFTDKQLNKVKIIVWNNEKNEAALANPQVAGTARYVVIRGQDFYSGMDKHLRAKIIREIKNFYLPYVENIPKDVFKPDTPYRMQCVIYDTVNNVLSKSNQRWDVGNRGYPYLKSMLDLLATGKIGDKTVMSPILEDDDRTHITEESARFIAIEADRTFDVYDEYAMYTGISSWLEFNFYVDTKNPYL